MNKNILIITRNAWNEDNSIGNTLTDLFGGWGTKHIANLFCRAEKPKNKNCKKYYRITESELLSSTLNRNKTVGNAFTYDQFYDSSSSNNNIVNKEKKMYDYFRNHRYHLLLWARELLWCCNKWNNDKLDKFLKDFNPQIIYMPLYDCFYMHRILKYVRAKTKAKVILWTTDDFYTLKQFSLSPLYWINRLILRRYIRQTIKTSDLRYCITYQQKKEYEPIFKKDFIVTSSKGIKNKTVPVIATVSKPIKLVFTGNIIYGRWKTLAKIGRALEIINEKEIKAQLYIYSMNLMTAKMCKALNIKDSVLFMGGVPSEKIQKIQESADILVHVESFELKEKLKVRLSFSTKLVDYFSIGRCIFAVGSRDVASIDYLILNDAAVVAADKQEIFEKLKTLIENPSLILKYGQKAWDCGNRSHQIDVIRQNLYHDIKNIRGLKHENSSNQCRL